VDKRFLLYYNRELQHLRETGGEFASEFPKIAGRLGIDAFDCADPYVERLLEGFAFMAARVQLKIDAEFPRFTQHLFETVFPHYLAPQPSMAVVQFEPDLSEPDLAQGYVVPRGSALRSMLGRGDQTACEYRSSADVTLWPLEISEAQYYTRELGTLGVERPAGVKAALRLRLKTSAGMTFNKTSLKNLVLFLRGSDEVPMSIYGQLFADAVSVVVRPTAKPIRWHEKLAPTSIRRVGFDEGQELLPYGPRSFHGYGLLREYFSLPQRFLFVEFSGLETAVKRCGGDELDLIVLLNRSDLTLENAVDPSQFALHCSPAINLFPKSADRIHLTDRQWEFHIIPDRTRPLDFEIYQVQSVTGLGLRADDEQTFRSFYSKSDSDADCDERAYYTINRNARIMSAKERRVGRRSSYAGSETFVSLVDANSTPYRGDLKQLAVSTLCTNRDLPLQMPLGQGRTDFTMESAAPILAIRCVAGPTPPKPSYAEGETAWRLISQLSLNYLSLVDSDATAGASALRDLLKLYGDTSDPHIAKQIDGVKSIVSSPLMRRVATAGPITFARGLELAVTFDETAFEGTGVFLLGAVLEQFFAKYVSINSFTETVIKTLDRGEVIRWPARIGLRQAL